MRNLIAIAALALLCTACSSEQHADASTKDWFVAYQSSRMTPTEVASNGLDDDAPPTPTHAGPY